MLNMKQQQQRNNVEEGLVARQVSSCADADAEEGGKKIIKGFGMSLSSSETFLIYYRKTFDVNIVQHHWNRGNGKTG